MSGEKDRRLLLALLTDSRASVKKLAQQAAVQRDVIAYRLKRLPMLKRLTARVDQSFFAAGIANMRCTLIGVTPQRFTSILRHVIDHPKVNWVAEVCGTADLIFTFLYKDNQDLAGTVADIMSFMGQNLKHHVLSIYIEELKFDYRGLLTGKGSEPRSSTLFADRQRRPLDSDDLTLLRLLQTDARLSSVALAAHTSIASDMVRLRIRAMEGEGIIKGYTAVLDSSVLGFESYHMGLRMQSLAPETIEKVRTYAFSNPYIIFCVRVSGNDDILLTINAKDRNHFRQLLLEIRTALSDVLLGDEFQIGLQEHKEVFVPEFYLTTPRD